MYREVQVTNYALLELNAEPAFYNVVDGVLRKLANAIEDVDAPFDQQGGIEGNFVYVLEDGQRRPVVRHGAWVKRFPHPWSGTLPTHVRVLARVVGGVRRLVRAQGPEEWELIWLLHAITRLDIFQTSAAGRRLSAAAREVELVRNRAAHPFQLRTYDLQGSLRSVVDFVEALRDFSDDDEARAQCDAFLADVVRPLIKDYRKVMQKFWLL